MSTRTRRRLLRASLLACAVAVNAMIAGCGDAAKPSASSAGRAAVAPGITVSPEPGSANATAQTEISFLGATQAQLGAVTVVGSRTGAHSGRLASYASETGTSFVSSTPFRAGEQVTVHAASAGVGFQFTVARAGTLTAAQQPASAAAVTGSGWNFLSMPSLHPATTEVHVAAAGTAPGSIFLAPIQIPNSPGTLAGQPGPLIVDDAGNPVWQGTLPAGLQAMDFRPQTYDGKTVLTWWQGKINALGYGQGEDEIVDSSYRTVATVRAGNGYQADMHEFLITPSGTAFVTAYAPVHMNLTKYGGGKDDLVQDSVVQEIDIKTGRVMFQWDPLDHVGLGEPYTKPSSGTPWDAFHVNSISVTPAGKLLISARNTWTVYEVDPATGSIDWRLGGKKSTFKLGSGVRFAWQHDAQQLPDGTISLFDDEAAPQIGSQSRGLVVTIDKRAKTATLARDYAHPAGLLAGSQGNQQTLPNGDVFEGWGAQPYYSEFSAGGELLYDAKLETPDESYRAYRATWSGRPADPPAMAVRPAAGGGTTVYASWNGATEVARWQVLSGPSAANLAPVAAAARSGFETAVPVAARGAWYAVRALDSSGKVLGTSRPMKA